MSRSLDAGCPLSDWKDLRFRRTGSRYVTQVSNGEAARADFAATAGALLPVANEGIAMKSLKSLRVLQTAAAVLALTCLARSAIAEFEFGIPTPVPPPINIDGGFGYPTLADDGLTMYFAADPPYYGGPYSTGHFDIWKTTRASLSDPWGPYVNLGAPINTQQYTEIGPSFTADRHELFFMRSLSPFGLPEGDLFVSHQQTDGSYGDPVPLSELNSAGNEGYPSVSSDGLTLYFSTVGLTNPKYPNPTNGEWNTFVAHRPDRNSPFGDAEFFFGGYGHVSPDGLTHIIMGYPDFAEHYDVPNVGDADLYVRTRESVDDPWGPIQWLKPPVNSSGQLLDPPWTGVGLECCGTFSAADSMLYFTSVRPGSDPTGPVGFVDMWQVPLAEAVPVDVKPGADPAPINLKSNGVLPVAVLSTTDFDATAVDAATLKFGDPLLIADGATPADPLRWSYEDVNHDGLDDLSLKFSLQDLRATGVFTSSTTEGYLAGQLQDGSHIAGRDAVLVFSPGRTIPEPAGLVLMIAGLAALAAVRRR
ncbi:MAG: hypothetical protein CMJ58_28310 [Planctomycetaceae bacterium]|nr:hypothetical protein [Planctomycetaceae bacterium]